MKRFLVVRSGKVQGRGVDFGKVVAVQWFGSGFDSPFLYSSDEGDDALEALRSVLAPTLATIVLTDSEWFERAGLDAMQSRCENTPFGDIGGLDNRARLVANDPTICPDYVPEMHRGAYLDGYRHAALMLYGSDWASEFGWFPALTTGVSK